MVDGFVRAALPAEVHEGIALYVLIFSIGIADWPQYARVVRAGTAVQKTLGYVAAARVMGASSPRIVLGHILPNVLSSVFVLGTLGFTTAIIAEATLSFLGVGMPPTSPSLGTLIRIGNDFLFSGEWWITLFPSLTLVALALGVNVLGDWLRDALNPRLRT
jgi:peptide/nickel transport system permease protein